MKSNKFKIGDLVMIDKNSIYYTSSAYNPKDTLGIIIYFSGQGSHFIEVKWINKSTNGYRPEDLNRVYYNGR